jgi:hypothetical protein
MGGGGNPERKRSLGRPRRRWVTILKWILERKDGMVWTGSNWNQDRDQWKALVNTMMNLQVP